MGKNLKFVIPLAVMILLVIAGKAYAVGTASGTLISNFATMTASNVPSATQSATWDETVLGIYGATITVDPGDGNASVGASATYVFEIQNPGNDTDLIGIRAGAQSFGSGAGTTANWSVEVDDQSPFVTGLIWQNSGLTTAGQAGDQATMAAAIAPDAIATYTVVVTTANDASDGSTGSFEVSFVTAKTPAGQYTGFNGTDYGGPAEAWRNAGTVVGVTYLTTTVQGPILTLTKIVNGISAPAGYTGGGSDPVPGARITYEIVFGNSGTLAATTVVLTDYVPTNTTYETGTILSCFTGTACAVNPDGDADVGGDDCWWNGTNIGCDIASIGVGSGGKLQYNVTID
ncbi:MAG: hypothetical protein AB1546_05085 [bacterium]